MLLLLGPYKYAWGASTSCPYKVIVYFPTYACRKKSSKVRKRRRGIIVQEKVYLESERKIVKNKKYWSVNETLKCHYFEFISNL